MNTYIALLRGINVSGHKKILMADLRELMKELHFKNVQTFIQSGNIIFDFDDMDLHVLSHLISEKIKLHYGFEVITIIRTPSEIASIISQNPFLLETEKEPQKMCVVFLDDTPTSININQLMSVDYSPEKFIINNKTLYFYANNGVGRSKLSTNFFEKKLKVNATARNWNTAKKLLELSYKSD